GPVPGPVHGGKGVAPHAARDPARVPGPHMPRLRGSPAHEPPVPLLPHPPLHGAVYDAHARSVAGIPRAGRWVVAVPDRARRGAAPAVEGRDVGGGRAARGRARGTAARTEPASSAGGGR